MLKKMYLVLFTMSLMTGSASFAAGETFRCDFSEDPNLKITSKPPVEKGGYSQQTTTLDLPASQGRSFALEIGLEITKFQHYGTFTVALTDALDNASVKFSLNMGDDRVQRCRMEVQEGVGIKTDLPALDKISTGKYKFFVNYSSVDRKMAIIVKDIQGTALYEKKDIPVQGKINFKQLQFIVTANDKQLSEISYLPAEHSIFYRSYVGNEGWYAYVIEGKINMVSMLILD